MSAAALAGKPEERVNATNAKKKMRIMAANNTYQTVDVNTATRPDSLENAVLVMLLLSHAYVA